MIVSTTVEEMFSAAHSDPATGALHGHTIDHNGPQTALDFYHKIMGGRR